MLQYWVRKLKGSLNQVSYEPTTTPSKYSVRKTLTASRRTSWRIVIRKGCLLLSAISTLCLTFKTKQTAKFHQHQVHNFLLFWWLYRQRDLERGSRLKNMFCIVYKVSAWACYLVMYLLLTECHQNDRNEEVEHHKGHKHNTGANEKCTKYWIVVKNLKDNTEEIGKRKIVIFYSGTILII